MLIADRRSASPACLLAHVVRRGAIAGCLILAALALAVPSADAATTPVVALGTSSTYAVLSGASVGNTVSAGGAPHTTLRGGLAVKANTQPLGFPPGVVTGPVDIGNAAADRAVTDATAAYTEIAGRASAVPLAGALAGVTVGPGLYVIAGAVSNTTTVTLDAGGNPSAVFVFQVGGALAMAAGSHVVLAGGAQASHVFWQVNGAGSVGAGSTFAGTMIALDAVAIGNGSVVNGRAFALNGALTLDADEFYSSPPIVTITGGPSAFTADTTPTISGTTDIEAPATVTVVINGQTLTTTPSAGAWSVTSAMLVNASYPVVASVTDGAFNTTTASQSLTVDTVLPIVTLAGGLSRTTNDPTPTIGGTSDVAPGSIVLVTVGSQALSALVQPGGTWNVAPPALADGTWNEIATVFDLAGNQGIASQTLTIDTIAPHVTFSGGTQALTNDPTPAISGTAAVDPGAVVTVTLADETLTGTVQTDGSWAVIAGALADGPHRVIMDVSDEAGNHATLTQTLTIDTVSPIVTINGAAAAATDKLDPTITGMSDAAPGTIVTVLIAGQTITTLLQQNGSWNATSTPIGEGVWAIVATVPDPAGNVGRAGQTLTVRATQPPARDALPVAPITPNAPSVPIAPTVPPTQPSAPPSREPSGGASEVLANTIITPDRVQKLAGHSLSIRTKVTAPPAGRLRVTANGWIRIAGVSRKVKLTTRKMAIAAGHSATLRIAPRGNRRVAAAVCAGLKAAVEAGKKVTATLTLTLVDAAGRTRAIERRVRLT